MEADDLDNLIADSLCGVQSALDADRQRSANAADVPVARSAGEAIRDLRQGPRLEDANGDDKVPNEELFANLVKTLQDDSFQKAIVQTLQGKDGAESSGEPGAASETAPPASADDSGVEDFLQKFIKSFEDRVGSDSEFDKQISSMMASLLSNDLMCEPLQQIADSLEPWIKNQKGLAPAEKHRYEEQLRMYKKIVQVYKSNPDPLPEPAREEVQRLLAELHSHGNPPDEVMRQIAPKDAEDGGESFEDFMKTMKLDEGLGASEKDLLKKLTEDPEELQKAMKEMADGLPEEGCKQQ